MPNIFGYFDSKKKERIKANLGNVSSNDELFNRLTTLQNEVGVSFNTKVTAITSIASDELSAHFAKAYADAYVRNGCSVLIIDANMYNPCLNLALGLANVPSEEVKQIADKIAIASYDKENYPSEVYKTGVIQNLVKENLDKYDHIVLLVPAMKKHQEVSLLADILGSILLLVEKNKTRKGDIYRALVYCAENKLPAAKTVVLK